MYKKYFILLFPIIFCFCKKKEKFELPIYGIPNIKSTISSNGNIEYDTIDHIIENFELLNQNGDIITNKTFDNKIYVADFFFTSCPTICPKMTKNLYYVYESYKKNNSVLFISHTIDPKNDTVEKLKSFSQNLGIKDNKWHFLTGDLNKIYHLGMRSYMVSALEEESAPGGFMHGSAFVLVDKERRVRGVYDGTSRIQTNRLIIDINNLINSD